MATNKPQDDFQKQGVRLPRALHERIHAAALESGRSYNAELIHRVEQGFDGIEDKELVLGLARQAWALRTLLAAAHVHLAYLVHEAKELGYSDAKELASLKEFMNETAPHAQFIVDLPDGELAKIREQLRGDSPVGKLLTEKPPPARTTKASKK